MSTLTIDVEKDGWTGGLQISINVADGGGYRIAGPKYNGSSKNLLSHRLTKKDADEIRDYLNAAFPADERIDFAGLVERFFERYAEWYSEGDRAPMSVDDLADYLGDARRVGVWVEARCAGLEKECAALQARAEKAEADLATLRDQLAGRVTDEMVELGARAIDPEIWTECLPVPTRGAVESFHRRRQESSRIARAALEAALATEDGR